MCECVPAFALQLTSLHTYKVTYLDYTNAWTSLENLVGGRCLPVMMISYSALSWWIRQSMIHHLDTIRNGIAYEPLARSDNCLNWATFLDCLVYASQGFIAFCWLNWLICSAAYLLWHQHMVCPAGQMQCVCVVFAQALIKLRAHLEIRFEYMCHVALNPFSLQN